MTPPTQSHGNQASTRLREHPAIQEGLRRSRSVLLARIQALLFDSAYYAPLHAFLDRLARSDAPALILGELGSGKAMVAEYLHHASQRRGPYVFVNCKALDPARAELELFGYEDLPGPDGSPREVEGCFEAARGGSLFLDEIEALSPTLQVKLLHALQERRIQRTGASIPVGIDVRLIVAAGTDLASVVKSGDFREDLYYQLNVAPVRLLPLRARPDDVIALVRYFAQLYGPKLGHQDVEVTPEAEALLRAHPWHGNIRELENTVHYAMIVSRDGRIGAADLRLLQASGEPTFPVCEPGSQADADLVLSALDVLFGRLFVQGQPDLYELVERSLVTSAFRHCKGNQVQTAKCLSVSRNVVRTQLKRFRLLEKE